VNLGRMRFQVLVQRPLLIREKKLRVQDIVPMRRFDLVGLGCLLVKYPLRKLGRYLHRVERCLIGRADISTWYHTKEGLTHNHPPPVIPFA
jgi:hypothetical protein